MFSHRLSRIVAVTTIALAAVLSTTTLRAQGLTKIRLLMPVTQVDEAYAPFMIAKELGYFQGEGLDVAILPTAGTKNALIQIAANNAEVAVLSPVDLMTGQQPPNDMQVQLFYDIYYKNIWSISVLPDSPIRSLADLKGKKIGVASMGSSGVSMGKAFLAKAGLEMGRDAQFVAIGAGGQGAAALRSKAVDAVVYWDAMITRLALAGLKLRPLAVDEKLRDLPDTCLGTTNAFMAKNPKAIIGIGRALAKGYVFNQANPEAAVRITWKHFPESRPRAVSESQALRDAVTINQSRMAIWSSPKTGGKFGVFIEADFRSLEAFAKQNGLLDPKADVSMAKLYTEKFVDDYGKFDRDAVVAQAKAWK